MMLTELYQKIEKKLDEIKKLGLIDVGGDDFNSIHKLNLRLAAAFSMDFYFLKLQNLSEKTSTSQRLKNKVKAYRKNLYMKELSAIEPMLFLEELLRDDPSVLNDSELVPILFALADRKMLNQVDEKGSILTRLLGGDLGSSVDSNLVIPFAHSLIESKKLTSTAVNAKFRGKNALTFLCQKKETKETRYLIQSLLQLGADVTGEAYEIQGKYVREETALLAAAKEGNFETLKILLQEARITPFILNMRCVSNKEYAPLDHGIECRHRGIVQTLLKAGAPITNKSFIRACETGDIALVKLLLDSKIQEETLNFNHALHKVCRSGFIEVADCLLRLGADVNFYYQSQALISTPLSEALLNGHVKLAQQLIKQGADKVFAQKIIGWSDLTLAIVLQDSYGVLKAYDKGESIDLNAKDWSLIPKALQQTCRGEACDITYLLHIMPKNQLPKPCPARRKDWGAVSAQIPEAKKAYAIISLKDVLVKYKQQRSEDGRKFYHGKLSTLFGGFSKTDKLSTVEKLLNHFSGICMESLTPRELRILSQGELGKMLRVWEKENQTNLQNTAQWFEVNILKPHDPARLSVPSCSIFT